MSAVSLKGTWKQALFTFFSPLILFLVIRWAVVEPFVIPSESMLPNLLIHDHILVFKSSFALKVPFSDLRILNLGTPEPGEVVVFKYPINPHLYYIKRVIGRPGDKLKISNGRIELNGQMAQYSPLPEKNLYVENLVGHRHVVRFLTSFPSESMGDAMNEVEEQSIEVPADKYFVMGDNRDASSDSRVWGFVPKDNLVGKTWLIWLSCEDTLTDVEFLCDPLKLRWERIFKKVEPKL